MMAAPTGPPVALPSLGSLTGEKIKRELPHFHHQPPTTTNMPDLPLISPSSNYSGPPPPYSYPSSGASSAVGGNHGTSGGQAPALYSSSQSQQASREDKGPSYTIARPSLPPLTEALSIKSMLNTSAPPNSSFAARSPETPTFRSHIDSATSRHTQNYLSSQQTPRSETMYEMARPNAATYSPRPTNSYEIKSPTQTNHSYASFSQSHPSRQEAASPPFARPGPSVMQQRPPQSPFFSNNHSHNQAEPTSSAPYGYQSHQPAYSYPPTTPAVTTYHTPILEQQPWRTGNPDLDRAEEVRKAAPKDSPPNKPRYGESVKRQLDIFDLETSLNEIAQGSGDTLRFAQHYGVQNHQTQRSGLLPGSLPPLDECDAMIQQQQRIIESMTQLRHVIYRQQQALVEQKHYDEQNHKPTAEPEEDSLSYQDKIDGGGGFAGPDSKKRRGRAAPPGRCHSCNRAETPEWRRGPDGARTLCNACGLHYAKLTRKMGNKTGPGPSSLRPKDSSPSSP